MLEAVNPQVFLMYEKLLVFHVSITKVVMAIFVIIIRVVEVKVKESIFVGVVIEAEVRFDVSGSLELKGGLVLRVVEIRSFTHMLLSLP